MKLLIITPLQLELDLFLQSCASRGLRIEHTHIGRLPVARLPELGLTVARGGVGKAQFALQTQHLLDSQGGWELVICAGAAGGLIDDLMIGDIVVATITMEHDYYTKFNARPAPQFDGDPAALAGLQQAASMSKSSFQVYFGVMASGDEDVIDDQRKLALRQATGALAVAWEGAGGARACAFSGVPFIEMRGVTDSANHSASADFALNLASAMHNIATLITSWAASVGQPLASA